MTSSRIFGIRVAVWMCAALFPVLSSAVSLEPPKEGFVPAPIHSDALRFQLTLKTRWPTGREKPRLGNKTLYVAWNGLGAKTPQGHPFPALEASIEIVLPVGSSLASQTDKAIRGNPLDSTHDSFRLNLPITRMAGSHADFFVRFHDGTIGEFELEYGLELAESVFNTHKSCDRFGIKINELAESPEKGFASFFFARCNVEDGILYVNILKPQDRVFVLRNTDRQFLETSNQPVIRVVLPQDQEIRRATVGEMRLTDGKKHTERYEVVYEPPTRPSRFNLNAGLSPSFINYRESYGGVNVDEAALTAKVTAGAKVIPGVLDASFSAYGTLFGVVLSPNDRPAARWLGLNYRVGYTLPVGLGATTFSFLAGWYSWYMLVPHNEYGIQSIDGPQFFFAANHHPAGKLGWSAYFKFAAIGQGPHGIDPTDLSQNEIAAGGSYDLPIFGELPRRPALSLDLARLSAVISKVTITQLSLSLGLSYPLF